MLGNKGFTLLACRYVSGETTGLYSPEGFTNGALLDAEVINGGNLYNIATSGPEILGYGLRLKNYFGFMIANPDTVSALVNINIPLGTSTGRKIPTAMQMDDLLDLVKVDSNTFLYCHPRVLTGLREIKNGVLEMKPNDTNMNRSIYAWEGVPIITSYNFDKGTELDVTVA